MNENLKRILRFLVILILILINIIILRYNLKKEKTQEKNTNNTNNINTTAIAENKTINEITESINKQEEKKVSKMSEGQRAKAYLGEFIEAITDGNYSDAYNMLNEEYRKNYFTNQSDFENYIKTSFPQGNLAVEYSNFDRKGDIYVLDVNIYNVNNADKKINKTVVIRENGLNDFKISFSK